MTGAEAYRCLLNHTLHLPRWASIGTFPLSSLAPALVPGTSAPMEKPNIVLVKVAMQLWANGWEVGPIDFNIDCWLSL